jgi:hypothetical protein
VQGTASTNVSSIPHGRRERLLLLYDVVDGLLFFASFTFYTSPYCRLRQVRANQSNHPTQSTQNLQNLPPSKNLVSNFSVGDCIGIPRITNHKSSHNGERVRTSVQSIHRIHPSITFLSIANHIILSATSRSNRSSHVQGESQGCHHSTAD